MKPFIHSILFVVGILIGFVAGVKIKEQKTSLQIIAIKSQTEDFEKDFYFHRGQMDAIAHVQIRDGYAYFPGMASSVTNLDK